MRDIIRDRKEKKRRKIFRYGRRGGEGGEGASIMSGGDTRMIRTSD